MHVDQGDGALLISPRGETVLFDNGVLHKCDLPLSYLSQLGIQSIDYSVVSHYHADHIGCATEVFGAYPIRQRAYDRGLQPKKITDVYTAYVTAVGNRRTQAQLGQQLVLDAGTANPIVITFQAMNAQPAGGAAITSTNENDLSLVALVRFGAFDAVIGGDLSGAKTSSYKDIETSVAPRIGQVELYKVNHHGSEFSSNPTWLSTISPLVGIISAGVDNLHGHPTQSAMDRMHAAHVRTYWTSRGAGEATPLAGSDVVAGNIVVEVAPGSPTFTVSYGAGHSDVYRMIGVAPDAAALAAYAWSTKSSIYHHANCSYVANIAAANMATGSAPPAGKTLHAQCPRHGGGQ